MGWDTGIANRLRAAGVRVIECAGWTTRGSTSFGPGGALNHHTADGASGATPSLNTCIYGRDDLDGPLCQVMQSREPDGNDIAYVIAAGRANHAGEGSWKGLSGNSSVYGLEIEHTGTDPLPEHRQQIAARIIGAMFGGSSSMVCQHREWTTRKIDAAENVDANAFRSKVDANRQPLPPPKPVLPLSPEEDDPMLMFVSDGKPVYFLSGGKAAGLKASADQSALGKLGVPTVKLTAGTYQDWIQKFRDADVGSS